MPCTAIKIGDLRMKFLTTSVEFPNQDGEIKRFTNIELYQCDEDFIPIGKSSRSIHEHDEETYHRELRKASFEKGHLVKDESTDPEWNPDYNPEEHGDESALSSCVS